MPDTIQWLTDEPMPYPERGADATLAFSLEDGEWSPERVEMGQTHLLFDHERGMASVVADVTGVWVEQRRGYKAALAEVELYELPTDPAVVRATYLIREKQFKGYSIGAGYITGQSPVLMEYEADQWRLKYWGVDEISMTPTPRNIRTATVANASGAGLFVVSGGIAYCAMDPGTDSAAPQPGLSTMTDADVARGIALYLGGKTP